MVAIFRKRSLKLTFVDCTFLNLLRHFFPCFIFSTVKITRAGLAKFATDIISLSYLFSAAERTNEIIVGTDQLMEI